MARSSLASCPAAFHSPGPSVRAGPQMYFPATPLPGSLWSDSASAFQVRQQMMLRSKLRSYFISCVLSFFLFRTLFDAQQLMSPVLLKGLGKVVQGTDAVCVGPIHSMPANAAHTNQAN